MKRILVLLVAACCLLVSCQKEQLDPNLDGTTWEFSERIITLKNGEAIFYYGESYIDTVHYSINGDTITFDDYLGGCFDLEGTINKKRDIMYITEGYFPDLYFVKIKTFEFVRVKN